MMGEEHWKELRENFEKDFVSVYQIDSGSQLVKTVKTGLSVLKTRQCLEENSSEECPACTGPLKELAATLPHGHYETTKIRCRLTGKLMTEDDPPMALPNGQVYSLSGLKSVLTGEMVRCAVSGKSYLMSEARKCYFL